MRLRLKKGEHLISLSNTTAPLKIRIDQHRQMIGLRVLGGQIYANGSAFQSRTSLENRVSSLK